jgi:uncharacterized protein involved in exopolysaccharide biosynthesis
MKKMIENEMNSMEFQEEEAPLFDFKQLWMLFVLNWRWFIASVVACVMIAYVYSKFQPNDDVVSNKIQIMGNSKQSGGAAAASRAVSGALNALPVNLGSSIGGPSDLETEKELLMSKPLICKVVKDLGLYAEYRVGNWMRTNVLYKTQPVEVTLDLAHLKWFDDQLPLVYHEIDLTIQKTSSEYRVDVVADGHELPTQTFNSIPATVKTDIGTVTIAPNPLLNADQAKAYEDGFKLMVNIIPPKTRAQMIGWNLTVEPPSRKSANLLDITLHDENYLRAIDIINSLVDHYNKYGNEQKDESVRQNEEFVNSRLAKLDAELGTSDANWENYKRGHEILDPDAAASEATEKKSEYEMQLIDFGVQLTLHDYQAEYITNPANLYKIYPMNEAASSNANGNGGGASSSQGSSPIERHNDLVTQRDDLLKSVSEKAPQILRLNEKIRDLQPAIQTSLNRDRQKILIQRNAAEREYNKAVNRFSAAPKMEREMTDIARQREIKQGVYLAMLQKREEIAMDMDKNTMKGQLIDDPMIGNSNRSLPMMVLGAVLLGLILPMGILYLLQMFKSRIDTKQELEEASKLPILSEVFLTNNDDAIRALRTNLLFNLKDGQKVIMLASHDRGDGKTYLAQRLVDSLTQIGKKAQYLNLNLREDRAKTAQAADLLAGADVAKQIETIKAANDYLILDTPEMAKYADVYQIAQFADATIFVVKAESTEKSAVKEIAKDARIPNPMLVLNAIDMNKKKYQYLYK